MTRYVTSYGDFKWMPKWTQEVDENIPHLSMTNGLGVTRAVRIGTQLQQKFRLKFNASLSTYREIRAFLRARGYGVEAFTWRYHEEDIVLTVRSTKPLNVKMITDNTANQNVLSVEFDLEFERQSDIEAM